jgi:PKD repeat protein
MVEFAILAPAIMLLFLIALDFGRAFATYVALTNVAREGAAYGAGNPSDTSGIVGAAGQEANVQTQGGEGALVVTAACADPNGAAASCAAIASATSSGGSITVTAAEQFTFLTPFISDLFGGGITLQASTTTSVFVLASGGGAAPDDCTTAPTAAFTVSVTDRTVTLDAAASIPHSGDCAISGYNWDMGDGFSSDSYPTDMSATYTYHSDGTYNITLQVTNPAGSDPDGYDTLTLPVIIGAGGTPGPSPSPTAAPTPTAVPSNPPPVCNTVPSFTYQFTGNGNGSKKHEMTYYGAYTGQPAPATWYWHFGDGNHGNGQTASRAYAAAGTYTVTLDVASGSCSKTVSQEVTVP